MRFQAAWPLLVLLAHSTAPGLWAQDGEVPSDETLINYAYTLGTGWDAFHAEGRSVQLYRLPFSYRLRSLEKGDRWGLRLSLPVSFGFHDFKGYTISFGGGLEYSGSTTFDGELSQGFTTIELGVDALRPLGLSFRGHKADASVYLVLRRFFDLELAKLEGDPVEIEHVFEIGVTFGTKPRFSLWKLKLPRVGVAYRFSGELSSWRINFGFPF